MTFSSTDQARLDEMAKSAATRAARETTQHLDGTVHVRSTTSLSASSLIALAALVLTIFGGMAGTYARSVSADAEHHQRLVALEKADEARRQVAAAERAELLGELRALRRELQDAIERMESKIDRSRGAR
jgi:hypothetical protein